MRAVLSWMQEFAPIIGEPDEIADQLTSLGLVVEEVQTVGADWDGIIVARVLDLRPHPEADKIQLVDVDIGDGEPLQICCGAFNMAVDDKVALATLGMTMPDGLEIARRKLRGEWSNGMICSSSELKIDAPDNGGILVLETDAPIGTPLSDALGATSDIVFEIDVEGNRPDGLSIIGITRDLAAKQGVPFTLPMPVVPEAGEPAAGACSAVIVDGDLCPRFGLRVLRNITNGQSPAWMQARLSAAGMRPISTIVDISNYVMLETGQPNHTFDLATIPSGVLRVRRAHAQETLKTLDGSTRTLVAPDGSGIGRGLGDGVIANESDTAISLAGVMGGFTTEISDSTQNVLLEAAVWDRMSIAHTSRRLNLRSEASTRFERGVDHAGLERALDRFCELAADIAGAEIAPGQVFAAAPAIAPVVVPTRTERVNLLLGTDLDAAAMIGFLTAIEFECTVPAMVDGVEQFDVAVPPWRPDTTIEADIAEEIGRHLGFANIKNQVPISVEIGELSALQKARRRIRRAFAAVGCSEAMPMPFLAPGDLAAAGLGADGLTLNNPLVSEESVLRTSLLPGLLKALAYNASHRRGDVRLFELGSVYHPTEIGQLPEEPEQVAAILGQADASAAVTMLTAAGATLGVDLRIRNAERPGLHPTRSAEVIFRGKTIGEVGEIDPGVSEAFEVAGRVGWIRLDVAALAAGLATVPKAKTVSRFPSSDVDLAFIVPSSVEASSVRDSLMKVGRPLVQSAELFDVFRSDAMGEDRRSLAFTVRLQAPDRTLSDDDVQSTRNKMINEVTKRHKAELR